MERLNDLLRQGTIGQGVFDRLAREAKNVRIDEIADAANRLKESLQSPLEKFREMKAMLEAMRDARDESGNPILTPEKIDRATRRAQQEFRQEKDQFFNLTPLERYERKLRDIDDALKEGTLTPSEAQRARRDAHRELEPNADERAHADRRIFDFNLPNIQPKREDAQKESAASLKNIAELERKMEQHMRDLNEKIGVF